MTLSTSWLQLADRLREVAETDAREWEPTTRSDDEDLLRLGLVAEDGQLTDGGNEYFIARFVLDNDQRASDALGAVLRSNETVNGFCETLWAADLVPVTGAISLLRRLTGAVNEQAAKRWLPMMNAGGLVSYNPKNSYVRVFYNPNELVTPDENAEREHNKAHLISPDTPFGNLIALRDMLRAARDRIRWYEQHMGGKVLEVLYRELEDRQVSDISLLSGPANVTADLKAEFKRFQTELAAKRGIQSSWRVLDRKTAQRRHDRFFLTEGFARNLPPLNLILQGSTGEILASEFTVDEFDSWWDNATELSQVPTQQK